jgi:hypothetical protein
MLEPCTVTQYACQLISPNVWSNTVTDPSLCRVDKALIMVKWDCSQNTIATISAQLQGSVDIASASAHSLGQTTILIWFGLVVLLTYAGFVMGAYIYRK